MSLPVGGSCEYQKVTSSRGRVGCVPDMDLAMATIDNRVLGTLAETKSRVGFWCRAIEVFYLGFFFGGFGLFLSRFIVACIGLFSGNMQSVLAPGNLYAGIGLLIGAGVGISFGTTRRRR